MPVAESSTMSIPNTICGVYATCSKCGASFDLDCRPYNNVVLIFEPRSDIGMKDGKLIHKPKRINGTPPCGGAMRLYRTTLESNIFHDTDLPWDKTTYLMFEDRGCFVSEHCLLCPLEMCLLDIPRKPFGKRQVRVGAQYREISKLQEQGLNNVQIASQMGITMRTVQRMVKRAAERPKQGSESKEPTNDTRGRAIEPGKPTQGQTTATVA